MRTHVVLVTAELRIPDLGTENIVIDEVSTCAVFSYHWSITVSVPTTGLFNISQRDQQLNKR